MGENLPFSLARAESALPRSVTGLEHELSDYIHQHFWITTSGYFTQPPLECARKVFGDRRILYSIDYPYRHPTAGLPLLKAAQVDPKLLRSLAWANAEVLLKLKSTA